MTGTPRFATAAMALVLVACGDGTGPAVERNDPGTGTSTLRVQGDIEARDVPGGFVTVMEVRIQDALGDPVSGATVTIRNNDLGTTNLLENGVGSGQYRATVNSFPSGDFRLDVVRDTDAVERVIVGGLAVHTITSPAANATVAADQPLVVEWNRPTEAAGADLETRDFSANGISDTGAYTIPANQNPARADQRIRLWRYNRVHIAGGLPGSQLTLEVRNTVEPIIVQ